MNYYVNLTILNDENIFTKNYYKKLILIIQNIYRRWTPKTGQGAKLYVRLLKGGTDYGKNQKKAQSAV
jgi:hypothetical protein